MKAFILSVFVNKENKFGNPVGIVIDEEKLLSTQSRQKIASSLGFSETVFINNLEDGNISIYNPIHEVKFAGHAIVGTAYFINQKGNKSVDVLNCKGGQVKNWQKKDITWIRASLINTPSWQFQQLKDDYSVKNLSVSETSSYKHTVIWAWKNKDKGIIQARTFAPDWGIPEDEANGSGSMQLSVKFNRQLEIHHGKGSIIYAKPENGTTADVGGRIREDGYHDIV